MSLFNNKYPYTDYHELNLDWIIEKVQECINGWIELKREFANLTDAFNDLKAYVENYFATLDLSEEVNEVIMRMTSDGTMEALLKKVYGDKIGVEIVNDISEMTNPAKVYLLSSDPHGYLYFWNGSGFEVSSISYFNPINALSFTSADITNLNDLYREVLNVPTDRIALVDNCPPTNEGFIVMDLATHSKSSVQVAYNYGAYNPEARFYIRKKSSGNWGDWITYNAADYLDFIIEYTTGDLDDVYRSVTKITTENLPNVRHVPTLSRGVVVADLSPSDNAHIQLAYNYAADDIPLVWLRKKSGEQWSDWYEMTNSLWTTITSGSLDNYDKPGIVLWTTTNAKNIANNPLFNAAGYCETIYTYDRKTSIQTVKSWAKNFVGVEFTRSKETGTATWSDWTFINLDYRHNGYGFTVIGDSLSSGCTTRGDSENVAYQMESWGKILANKLGCFVYTCCRSGISTVDFVDESHSYGIAKLRRIPATPIYCINLGVNDVNQGVTEEVFKTNYRNIIAAIRQKNPNAIIFCFKLWRADRWSAFSTYIEELVDEYSDVRIALLDIQAKVLSAPISNHLFNGHFDVIAYKHIADAVEEAIMVYGDAHPEIFRAEFSEVAEGNNYQSSGYPFVL